MSTASHHTAANSYDRFLHSLEETIRKSPAESVIIAFLAGGLLQTSAVRILLLVTFRLLLALATPALLGLAIWRFWMSREEGRGRTVRPAGSATPVIR